MPLPPRRTRYDTVSSTDHDDPDDRDDGRLTSVALTEDASAGLASTNSNESDSNDTLDDDEDDTLGDPMTVTILDFCHKRWDVNVRTTSSVRRLKQAGTAVHSIAVPQQRLIYQGKLLQDTSQLADCKIAAGSIVHLFPKPRVVIGNSSSNTNSPSTDEDDENQESTGARVPTIFLDEDEAARRSEILVLGSVDYVEAVNNVKLFSFMLLIISTIELLNLMAIYMGDGAQLTGNPELIQEDDDFFPDDPVNGTFTGNETDGTGVDPAVAVYQTWTNLSYFDFVVSALGVYVALLGIKASNDNALAPARVYFLGTCLVGAFWLCYNYIMTIKVDTAVAEEMHNDTEEGSVYDQAFQVMVLPGMVWGMCIFRAWQFQHLLSEAEEEAANRIAEEADQDLALQTDNGSMA